MSAAIQTELFTKTSLQKFEAWKETPGGRHVLRDIYRLAAGYAGEWRRTRIPVSMKLLWEMERHRIKRVSVRAQRLGLKIAQADGYTLNNSFTALLVRHIYAHRPEWQGLFETRERRNGTGKKLALIIPLERAS